MDGRAIPLDGRIITSVTTQTTARLSRQTNEKPLNARRNAKRLARGSHNIGTVKNYKLAASQWHYRQHAFTEALVVTYSWCHDIEIGLVNNDNSAAA